MVGKVPTYLHPEWNNHFSAAQKKITLRKNL